MFCVCWGHRRTRAVPLRPARGSSRIGTVACLVVQRPNGDRVFQMWNRIRWEGDALETANNGCWSIGPDEVTCQLVHHITDVKYCKPGSVASVEFHEYTCWVFLRIETSSHWMHYNFTFYPLTAKLFNLNFHSLEVVSRWRDPQLQVRENYSIWQNGGQLLCWYIAGWCHILSLSLLLMWFLMCR